MERMERKYYINLIQHKDIGIGESIKQYGPMTKDRADRFFKHLDLLHIKPEFGYAIQMYSELVEDADINYAIDTYMEYGFFPIFDHDYTVHRIWACPAGYHTPDSWDVYDLKEWYEKQLDGLRTTARVDGLYHERTTRYAERARFTHWLYKVATREPILYKSTDK